RRVGPGRVRRRVKRGFERGGDDDDEQRDHAEHVSIVEAFGRLWPRVPTVSDPRVWARKVHVLLDPYTRGGSWALVSSRAPLRGSTCASCERSTAAAGTRCTSRRKRISGATTRSSSSERCLR